MTEKVVRQDLNAKIKEGAELFTSETQEVYQWILNKLGQQ